MGHWDFFYFNCRNIVLLDHYYHSHPLEIKKLYPPLSPIWLHLIVRIQCFTLNTKEVRTFHGLTSLCYLSCMPVDGFDFLCPFCVSVIDHGCFTVSSKTMERWEFKVAKHTHISLFSHDAIEKMTFKTTKVT